MDGAKRRCFIINENMFFNAHKCGAPGCRNLKTVLWLIYWKQEEFEFIFSFSFSLDSNVLCSVVSTQQSTRISVG